MVTFQLFIAIEAIIGRLPIRQNWSLSLSITVETLEAAFFRRRGVTLSANFGRKGCRSLITVAVRKAEWLAFVWYQNIHSALFDFVTKHACNGRTDRITTPKTALAYSCSRGKNSVECRAELASYIVVSMENKRSKINEKSQW